MKLTVICEVTLFAFLLHMLNFLFFLIFHNTLQWYVTGEWSGTEISIVFILFSKQECWCEDAF